MPWLLIVLVLLITGGALAARTNDERVLVIATGEAVIVAYFVGALSRAHRSAAHASQPKHDAEQQRFT